MANFVLVYKGGTPPGDSPEEQKQVMDAWMGWFGTLGAAVVDGGAPFGPSAAVAADGSISTGGSSALTGYSVLSAGSLAEATDLAKGCPVLSGGGSVEVYESLPIG
jgi:hypothetical protein